jgi:peptidyl-prolyl cis-trans isomerase D
MVGPFDSAVFAMEPGEISEPVRTRFGFHVIKAHEFREEGEKREVHASHILFKAKASQHSLDSLYNVLAEVLLQTETVGLEKAAEDAGLRVQTTRPLAREASIQQIGSRSAATIEFAFTAEPGAMTGVMENDAYFFAARANRKLGANTVEYGEVEGRVKFDLTRDQKIIVCMDSAMTIWQAIQDGADFKSAAEQYGQSVDTPPALTRDGSLPGIGRSPEALGIAFRLTQSGEVSEPVSYGNGVVLFKLMEKWSPELTAFTEKRDSVASAVLSDKQRLLYDRWYRNLVDQSVIINNVELQRSEAARSS